MPSRAVILAGGKGSRLRDRGGGLPKPLVPVAGRPILDWQFDLLVRAGIGSVAVLVSHGADQIRDHVAARRDLEITLIDDGTPRGTAGAVLAALDHLDDEFLVIYGDTVLDVDLERFYAWHAARPDGVASLLVHPNDHPADSDLVELDENDRVTAFLPYPRPSQINARNLVNAALYWVRKRGLAAWSDILTPMDFGRDLFPQMLTKGERLYGYRSAEYIKDAGTPARLDRTSADLVSGKVAACNWRSKRPAIFLDRDGTLNFDHSFINRPEQIGLIGGAAEAVRRINSAGPLAVVVTNQSVIARGECSEAEMERIHGRLEGLLGEGGAFLDRIYYCPHHPDVGFPGERPDLKIVCNCRKPATGMVEQATADMNIDLSRSWVIGDTTADFMLARRSGIRSIGVATGAAGLDGKYPAEADYHAADVASAVAFILDQHPRLLAQVAPLVEGLNPGDLVFIGGSARSGKSTLASALADHLAANDIPARVIPLDRWIRSLADRQAGVLGRYDIAAIGRMLKTLAPPRNAHVSISMPFYFRKNQQSVGQAETISVAPDEILIVEGTITLASAAELPARKVYIQSNQSQLYSRFMKLQEACGRSGQQAELLFAERQNDETSIIEQSRKHANTVVEFIEPFTVRIKAP